MAKNLSQEGGDGRSGPADPYDRAVSAESSRFWLWRLPAAVAIGATLLFAAGFGLALRGAAGRPLGSVPPAPSIDRLPTPRGGGRLLLVLGDSLARGTGDESGRGYAREVFEELKKRGPAEIANLSVNGAESAEVRDLASRPNVRSLAAAADWILLSVGGNDLSHSIPRPGDSGAGDSPLEEVRQAKERYAANLRAILAALREENPAAPIRVLGLYDPFETSQSANRIGASVILGWNAVIAETAVAFPDVLVVPTFDLFERREDRLALDHFHPNRAGYALIASRVLQGLR
jgi:lysophospholipase L1-like esterase